MGVARGDSGIPVSIPHYIYIYMIPPQGGRFSIQNFWKKSLKVQIVPKNRFKNSAEKLENMNSLDFT
jgi:hypothetical protein